MNRTGSIGSWVGPEVIRSRRPARSRGARAPRTASTMSSGSARRPIPSSPWASGPVDGSDDRRPPATRSMLHVRSGRGVLPHPGVHRGGETSGHVASSSVEVSRSSARPWASFAMHVRGGGHDDRDIGLPSEPDVQDLTRSLPQGRVRGRAGQRGERVGADEAGGGLGEHDGDLGAGRRSAGGRRAPPCTPRSRRRRRAGRGARRAGRYSASGSSDRS